ncbi:unnamed protein product [Lota lota]
MLIPRSSYLRAGRASPTYYDDQPGDNDPLLILSLASPSPLLTYTRLAALRSAPAADCFAPARAPRCARPHSPLPPRRAAALSAPLLDARARVRCLQATRAPSAAPRRSLLASCLRLSSPYSQTLPDALLALPVPRLSTC